LVLLVNFFWRTINLDDALLHPFVHMRFGTQKVTVIFNRNENTIPSCHRLLRARVTLQQGLGSLARRHAAPVVLII
jgi:hypothetical protein